MTYTEDYYKALELVKQWRESAETWQALANHATALAEEATADLKKANATIRALREENSRFLREIKYLRAELGE